MTDPRPDAVQALGLAHDNLETALDEGACESVAAAVDRWAAAAVALARMPWRRYRGN